MRVCGVCRKALRANDPGATFTVPPDNKHGATPGHYSGCTECASEYEPSPYFSMQVASICNPRGEGNQGRERYFHPLPESVLNEAPPWYCGICDRCAREDDRMEFMRLYAEDCPGETHILNNLYEITIGSIGPIKVEGLTEEKALAWFRRRFDNPEGEVIVILLEMGMPTGYYSCGECRKKYAPAILQRLKREKRVPEDMPVHAMSPFLIG